MKIKWYEEQGKSEVEIAVTYPQWNQETEQVKKQLDMLQKCISGNDSGRIYSVPIYQICYLESVDRRTYIYTADRVYRSSQNLKSLFLSLNNDSFVRISKQCFVNISFLENIKMLPNTKLEALLKNGEKLIVSRTYLKSLRERLEGLYD